MKYLNEALNKVWELSERAELKSGPITAKDLREIGVLLEKHKADILQTLADRTAYMYNGITVSDIPSNNARLKDLNENYKADA
ncbi:MAG: hypothetical protein D6710_08310 [Nitrospirae bacterium]|nr:MAG: hypothetical protein D6710_08310 [Nitrospirota bacterium]